MTRPPLSLEQVASVLRAADVLREIVGREDVSLVGVSQDSRTVRPGELFLAWVGVTSDAHDYVADAAERGAAAALVERYVPEAAIPQIVVSNGRYAAALAADTVLGSPGRELVVVAVTGTNGKTTTSLLLRHLLAAEGRAATIGTLGLVQPDGSVRPGTEGLTTPGPVQLATWLRALADEGVRFLTMEASSHALSQRRLDALEVSVAVFTNLSQDHLDYHGDVQTYFRAKARLMDLLREDGASVVNAFDDAWRNLPPQGRRRLSFGIGEGADVRADDLELEARGSTFRLVHGGASAPVRLPLPGRFNVENALAAAAAAIAVGVELPRVAERLADAPQVPGRLEVVRTEPCTVLIDFAHTPAALAGVLDALRPLARGRLVVLFGAGGDRDRSKRLPMAEAVAGRADHVILTSDNPRTEDPERILDDLEPGLAGASYERVADRREAIRRALAAAAPGDVLLLAGKGHETYQVVGSEKRPFNERVIVAECLARRGAA